MTIDTLWFTRCPSPSAASIAIRENWLVDEFAPDGIAVKSLASSSDKSVQLSHYRHTQPNSFRFGGWVPPLVSASRGADVKVIGLAWPDRAGGVLALPGSGIRTPEDLRGKRFSLPRRKNDSVDWWHAAVLHGYASALRRAGLRFRDVQLVEVDIEREYVADATTGDAPGQSLWGARSQFAVQREEVAALYRGEVDVLYSDAAMGALLRAFVGPVIVVDLFNREEDSPEGDGQPVVLTVSGGLLRERPDLVERWLVRLLDADAWARSHPAEARRIFAVDTGLPEDLVDDAFSPRLTQQIDVSLSPRRVAQLARLHEDLLTRGIIDSPIDFERFIDPAPLAAACELWRRRQLSKAAA
jgi:ABC-type nitrate/sulfonate/bicarbonate transport system substrate-binding protein